MLGPFATASRRTPIHQVSLLSHARINVHNDDDNDNNDNDNAWQRGPLWPHRMRPNMENSPQNIRAYAYIFHSVRIITPDRCEVILTRRTSTVAGCRELAADWSSRLRLSSPSNCAPTHTRAWFLPRNAHMHKAQTITGRLSFNRPSHAHLTCQTSITKQVSNGHFVTFCLMFRVRIKMII